MRERAKKIFFEQNALNNQNVELENDLKKLFSAKQYSRAHEENSLLNGKAIITDKDDFAANFKN